MAEETEIYECEKYYDHIDWRKCDKKKERMRMKIMKWINGLIMLICVLLLIQHGVNLIIYLYNY